MHHYAISRHSNQVNPRASTEVTHRQMPLAQEGPSILHMSSKGNSNRHNSSNRLAILGLIQGSRAKTFR